MYISHPMPREHRCDHTDDEFEATKRCAKREDTDWRRHGAGTGAVSFFFPFPLCFKSLFFSCCTFGASRCIGRFGLSADASKHNERGELSTGLAAPVTYSHD